MNTTTIELAPDALKIDTETSHRLRRKANSPTLCAAYGNCHAQWAIQALAPDPGPAPDSPLTIGNAVHAAFELLHTLPAEQRTRAAFDDACALDAADAAELDPEGTKALAGTVTRHGDGLWQIADPAKADTIETELVLNHAIDGMPFTGKVDRIDRNRAGKLVVIDYKTGKRKRPYAGKDAYADQLRLYGRILAEQGMELASSAELWYTSPLVEEGKRVRKVPLDEKSTGLAVERAKERWQAHLEETEKGEFPYSPGPLCGWCPLAKVCPNAAREPAEGTDAWDSLAKALPGATVRERAEGERTHEKDAPNDKKKEEEVPMNATPATVEAPATPATPAPVDAPATPAPVDAPAAQSRLWAEAKPWDGPNAGPHLNAAHPDHTGIFGFHSLAAKLLKERRDATGLNFAAADIPDIAQSLEWAIRRIEADIAATPSAALRTRLRGLAHTWCEVSPLPADGWAEWLRNGMRFIASTAESVAGISTGFAEHAYPAPVIASR